MLDEPCLVHKGMKHTMRECMGLAKALLDEQNKKRNYRDDDKVRIVSHLGMRVALSKNLARPSIPSSGYVWLSRTGMTRSSQGAGF